MQFSDKFCKTNNFSRYNLNPQNLAEHGIHWRMTHFLVNVPLLYNVLGVAGLVTFAAILYRLVSMLRVLMIRYISDNIEPI